MQRFRCRIELEEPVGGDEIGRDVKQFVRRLDRRECLLGDLRCDHHAGADDGELTPIQVHVLLSRLRVRTRLRDRIAMLVSPAEHA